MIWNDSIQLPGTLTYSKATLPQPIAIFVHGSGNIDRNGNQARANIKGNYIQQLADSLNQKGIAFYRYDKRTATPENFKYIIGNMVYDYLVDDLKLAIQKFKNDDRFSSITLIGHSQGSLTAILAAQTNVSKYISLAGTGEGMDSFIINSYKQVSEEMSNKAKAQIDELLDTGEIKNVEPSMAHLFNKPNQTFLASWMSYNPAVEIKKLNIPVLILNGSKDLQVTVINAKMLHEAKPDSELKIIENMNHMLKHITKDEDNMKSYFSPDYPLSQSLVETISTFISKQHG
jgi:pimeloyl-ACP methyl ester carboxylesterase